MTIIQISDRIDVKVTYYYIAWVFNAKSPYSIIVSLWCSTWVIATVILESDLRYLELYPCLELLAEVSLPFKL